MTADIKAILDRHSVRSYLPKKIEAETAAKLNELIAACNAVNQQKFRIALKEDGTVEFTDMGGILSKIDLGIVKYHFEIGSTQWN